MTDPIDDDEVALELTPAELEALDRIEAAAHANPNVRVVLPPRLALAVLRDFRRSRRQRGRAFADAVEATDLSGDVSDRLRDLRDDLQTIADARARSGEPASRLAQRMRAQAARALRRDDDREDGMISEFGYGALTEGDEPEEARVLPALPPWPEPGRIGDDRMGNIWRVTRADDEGFVYLELLAHVGAVLMDTYSAEVADLTPEEIAELDPPVREIVERAMRGERDP